MRPFCPTRLMASIPLNARQDAIQTRRVPGAFKCLTRCQFPDSFRIRLPERIKLGHFAALTNLGAPVAPVEAFIAGRHDFWSLITRRFTC